jgi:hypothetical protein
MPDAPRRSDHPEAAPSVPWLTTPRRAAILTGILAVALLSGMLLSPKLWLSSRFYPLAPISDHLPPIPSPLDVIWFGSILLLLAASVLPRFRRWLLTALLVLAATYTLWDQSRWQPWVYQYLAMLTALAWAAWRSDSPHAEEAALNVCRFIVAATYAWSGVQKMNATFVSDVYPWLLQPLLTVLPRALHPLASGLGPAVPFVELAVGVGLLLRPVRAFAIWGAVVMHLLLLVILGPTGYRWNTVVWPWNAAMILMVLLLFWRTPELTVRAILWPRDCLYARAVLLLFGVLPGLHLVGLWDAYLSASLYSGNTLEAYVVISPEQREQLPAVVLPEVEPRGERWRLTLSTWSMREMNVPDYPARRVYLRLAEELARRTGEEVTLVIAEQPHWRSGERRETTYRCGARGQ